MGSDVSYLRLAEVLIERLRPAVPARMVMRIASVAEVAEMNATPDSASTRAFRAIATTAAS